VAREEFVELAGSLSSANSNGDGATIAGKNLEDGSATLEKEQTSQLAARQKKFIEPLEAALTRIENKTKNIYLLTEKIPGFAKISVKDTGPGIAAEKVPFLFDRYFRAEQASKVYSGLGLGLYICAEIVKKDQGSIGVDTTPGVGSTFWFTLPLDADNDVR